MKSPQSKVWAITYFQVLIIFDQLCEFAGRHYLSAQVTIEEDNNNNNIIQIFISTLRHELADHIFCIPMSNCLIADTEVPENAHKAYRVKFLLNEMIMS